VEGKGGGSHPPPFCVDKILKDKKTEKAHNPGEEFGEGVRGGGGKSKKKRRVGRGRGVEFSSSKIPC